MLRYLLDFFFAAASPSSWKDELARAHIARLDGVPGLENAIGAVNLDKAPGLRKAIHRCKYLGDSKVCVHLGAMLSPCIEVLGPQWREAVLSPVPLHWMRQFSRGYNQSVLLAEGLAGVKSMRVTHGLRRNRQTGTQVGRSGTERRQALQGAFVVRGPVPERVIIVDDVLTTGATVSACAQAWREAGVKHIAAIAVAIG